MTALADPELEIYTFPCELDDGTHGWAAELRRRERGHLGWCCIQFHAPTEAEANARLLAHMMTAGLDPARAVRGTVELVLGRDGLPYVPPS